MNIKIFNLSVISQLFKLISRARDISHTYRLFTSAYIKYFFVSIIAINAFNLYLTKSMWTSSQYSCAFFQCSHFHFCLIFFRQVVCQMRQVCLDSQKHIFNASHDTCHEKHSLCVLRIFIKAFIWLDSSSGKFSNKLPSKKAYLLILMRKPSHKKD